MSESLQDRIRQRLKALGKTPRQVSVEIGRSPDFLRGVLRNPDSSPRGENLEALARHLETTEAWLLRGGDVAPPPLPAAVPINGDVVPVAAVSLDEMRAAMPQDVPVYGTAAGSLAVKHEGAFEMEARVIEYVRRPPALFQVRDAYAFYVSGGSMVPAHNPGDLRFVHPHKPPRQGDTVVVQARYAEHRGMEAFIAIYERRTAEKVVVTKLSPPATVEFDTRFVQHVHRVLTLNELFGV
ncbi:S24 family peptidase [Aurantimonas sp. VKM B-3413]|uniref:S24 family peptidase n=1 Tax=Aurantimonas sp. VKM B-3413 TaxID=2779401 RepID=UPI001E3CF967|nr:S24 family peptidase [Aurantimonas sp. VKM B-3413]